MNRKKKITFDNDDNIEFSNLPNEIINIIISFLNYSSQIKLLRCSKHIKTIIISNNEFKKYKEYLQKDCNYFLVERAKNGEWRMFEWT